MSARRFCKTRSWPLLTIALLLIWLPAARSADMTLGAAHLGRAADHVLKPAPMARHTALTQSVLYDVGGVAFYETAVPQDEQLPETVALRYLPDEPDGVRLQVTLDDERVIAVLFDWQIVPIAQFVDGYGTFCTTLFGHLENPDVEAQIYASGGNIINYHPAFKDTLLGLRLFQQDLLIINQETVHLPEENGAPLYGAGEPAIDLAGNRLGWAAWTGAFGAMNTDQRTSRRSYLICDRHVAIQFSTGNGYLELTGEPYYYCWRYRRDEPDYDSEASFQATVSALDAQLQKKKLTKEGPAQRKFLITELLVAAAQYENEYYMYDAGVFVELIRLQGESARRKFLDGMTAGQLRNLLIMLRLDLASNEVIFLQEQSDFISKRGDQVRGINPCVWDATVLTMRYAAFFRFCKRHAPENWEQFMSQINHIDMQPHVETPSTYLPAGAAPVPAPAGPAV